MLLETMFTGPDMRYFYLRYPRVKPFELGHPHVSHSTFQRFIPCNELRRTQHVAPHVE